MKKLSSLLMVMMMAATGLQAQLLQMVNQQKDKVIQNSIPRFLMKDDVARFIAFNADTTVMDIYGKGFIKERSITLSSQLREAIEKGREDEYEGSPLRLEYHNMDEGMSSEYNFSGISQTLFNTDDEFEFITLSIKETEEGEEGSKYIRRVPTTTVRNERGDVLFQFPEGEKPRYLILFNDDFYLSTTFSDGSRHGGYKLYKINRNAPAAVLQLVDNPMLLRVLNSHIDNKTTVFSLSEAADKHHTLSIVAADGRMMTQNTISAGERETKVNTARWSAGTYLYQLQKEGKNIESGKFIVR